MKCEGCDAKLYFASLPVYLKDGGLKVDCPICRWSSALWIRGHKVETEKEHEDKLNSWKKGDKS